MFRKLLFAGLLFAAAVLIGSASATADYYANLPQQFPQPETLVFGQNQIVPGSQAALRVIVRDRRDAAPLPDTLIKISLQPSDGNPALPVYSGVTGEDGTTDVAFHVPDDAAETQTLIVETETPWGADRIEQPIQLKRDYRILITTDKPLYQPGQVIHLRALALGSFDLKPAAGQKIEMTIADGKGNKVFRTAPATSDYGVASADFQLANEVNTGQYKISVVLGNTSSEKTVTVEHYTLPKFDIQLSAERSFYQPSEHVHGTLRADYFFGKPVGNSEIALEGYTFDVERTTTFQLQGSTDAAGNFTFEFDLPEHFTGSDLDNGLARYYLQASVTDQAQHTEVSNLSLPIASAPIMIQAIPESGQFRWGVENILYVLTSTPDGAPIETTLNLMLHNTNQVLTATTDRYGLAEVRFIPNTSQQSFGIAARAVNGAAATREFSFSGDSSTSTILLRPDRSVYRVGDSMLLSIFSRESGNIYLDIVRDGQTVSTRAAALHDGRAEVAVDLTPDLYGTLELHAYKVLSSGSIVRDTRLVIVDAAADLSVSLKPDRDVYRPGDQAGLDIAVKDTNGAGAQAALGLAVVDESVFALAEQDPGFAKLYFLLEQQLLEPKYDLHGLGITHLVAEGVADDPNLRQAQQTAARASLAEALPQQVSFSLAANARAPENPHLIETQRSFFTGLYDALNATAVLLAVAIFGLTVRALDRRRRLGESLFLAVVIGGGVWALLAAGDAWILLIAAAVILIPYILIRLIAITLGQRDWLMLWLLALLTIYAFTLYALGSVLSQAHAFIGYESQPLIDLSAVLVVLSLLMLLMSTGSGSFPTQSLSTLLILVVVLAVSCAPAAPALHTPQWLFQPAQSTALPQPTAAPQPAAEKVGNTTTDTGNAAQPPRLRQYFPETMLWLPGEVTDQYGDLHLDIPIADNITTWRMTALASTRDGRLSSATDGLRVFQDFFIDLDLPPALTVDDEVSVPVSVYNYLTETQSVRLELAQADWFKLLDEPTKTMTIAANDISLVTFRIRARASGDQPFKVTAWGSRMSDAIQKMAHVAPNGKPFLFTQSDRLQVNTTIRRTVSIPAQAIPGAQSLVVKIYPGMLSQVVEGLDSILRMPNGCFEQTSSTTYPNVLVLDYLRAIEQVSPETQLKAEGYINTGYQRLATFEVPGGGFSLFGSPPADRMLTAYGLQEFGDMSRVHDVDPAIVQRAAEWLMAQQNDDGSWNNDQGLVHESTWSNLSNDRLPVTAYLVWSLYDAGFGDDPRAQKGLSYVREFQADATDPYVVAMVANALVAADRAASASEVVVNLDPTTQAVLDRLAELAKTRGDAATWSSDIATFMGGTGQTGSLETTAMAALAFLRAGSQLKLAEAALTTLIQQKDSSGTWYTTQATVLALKALIQSVHAGSENVNATVAVRVDGGEARSLQVTPENIDVTQLLVFNDLPSGADHTVEISAQGEGNLMYQIAGSYYLPWSSVPRSNEQTQPVTIKVNYDRAQLSVNDSVTATVTVNMNQKDARADSALIDLGVPPGFVVQAEDLDGWVAHYRDMPPDYAGPAIQRYELTGRQILVYVSNLSNGNPLRFTYRLTARFPLAAQTPASSAYDYYNPKVAGETAPQMLTVNP